MSTCRYCLRSYTSNIQRSKCDSSQACRNAWGPVAIGRNLKDSPYRTQQFHGFQCPMVFHCSSTCWMVQWIGRCWTSLSCCALGGWFPTSYEWYSARWDLGAPMSSNHSCRGVLYSVALSKNLAMHLGKRLEQAVLEVRRLSDLWAQSYSCSLRGSCKKHGPPPLQSLLSFVRHCQLHILICGRSFPEIKFTTL